MSVLSAENISKSYLLGETEVNALRDVNLTLEKGAFAALSGSSGSGKTTLLNLLGGIDYPTSGKIFIAGKEASALNKNELARFRAENIGFIFQTFNLISVLTAFENIEYPLLLLKMKAADRKPLVEKALEQVGLSQFAHHRPSQLSGGQRQRVAIGRALVKSPAIILADEPTANLDHKTADSVLRLMQETNERDGVTFLFSSHDPMILSRAKKVFPLRDGVLSAT